MNFLCRPKQHDDLKEVPFGYTEAGEGESDGEDEEYEEEASKPDPGVSRVYDPGEAAKIVNEEAFIVYLQPLINLAQLKLSANCATKGCRLPLEMQRNCVGSALDLTWVCINNNNNICRLQV